MSRFKTMSNADIISMCEKYNDECFDKKESLADVQAYIASMVQEAAKEHAHRQSGAGIKTTKLWQDFYAYVSPTNSKVTGKAIRKHIRKRIEEEQRYQCCYCRRPLMNNAHAKPIEHILPHSVFVQHTFDIRNLSIACVDCNSKKTDNVWMSNQARYRQTRHYPPATAFSDMYHPRFHRYDEHVTFFRVQSNTHCISIYTGLTEQGKNLCKNLLTHISKLEIFVSANSDLKEHIEMIQGQDMHPGGAAEAAINAFKKAFQEATEVILDEI